jgi:hypothetical protein
LSSVDRALIVASPAVEHAARRMRPPKVRIVVAGVFAGTS